MNSNFSKIETETVDNAKLKELPIEKDKSLFDKNDLATDKEINPHTSFHLHDISSGKPGKYFSKLRKYYSRDLPIKESDICERSGYMKITYKYFYFLSDINVIADATPKIVVSLTNDSDQTYYAQIGLRFLIVLPLLAGGE